MSSLREWQRDFVANVMYGDAALPPGSGAYAQRLAIHRNNWRGNLGNALRAGYPVVERLVGAEFFDYMAQCFVDAHPSHSANLDDYGLDFADFIAAFAPAQGLPYLADMARLEAAIDDVLAAPDSGWLLQAGARQLRWQGAGQLLRSPYPLRQIWQSNQPQWHGPDSVNLDIGGEWLLVRRVDVDVTLEPFAYAAEVQLLPVTTPC